MTFFEEVTALYNEAVNKSHEVEYNRIKKCITDSANIGLSSAYIYGSISETIKDDLRKQGFDITYHFESEIRYGYVISW